MTPQEAVRRLLEQLPDTEHRVLPADSRSWERDELTYVWHRARADAELAYESWRRMPCADGYVVYRAAQDQLDAAQDALAWWVGTRVNGRSPPWGP